MRIVVFGATGTVGRPLLTELARTHEVFAVSRRPQHGNEATWIEADVLDAASVRRAVDGAEIVYYLVHSLGEGDFEERDAKAAETVAREGSAPAFANSSTSAGSATTRLRSRRTCAAARRRRSDSAQDVSRSQR